MSNEETEKIGKWSKLMKQLKEETEEELDENAAEEEVDAELKSESKTLSMTQAQSDGVSGTLDRISESMVVSLQWLDKELSSTDFKSNILKIIISNPLDFTIFSVYFMLMTQLKLCGVTPTTKRGQLVYMFIMLLIPIIPVIALISQNIFMLNSVIVRKTDLTSNDANVIKSDETARLIDALQQERTASLINIFIPKALNESILDIDKQRLLTDAALENITKWRAPEGEDMFRSKLRLQIRIDDFRQLQDERENTEALAYDTNEFYSYTTRVLLDELSNIIKTANGSRSWRYLVTYKNTLRAIENMGLEISFGIIFIGNGELNNNDFAKYIEKHYISDEYLIQSQAFLSSMRSKIENIKQSPEYKQYTETFRRLVKRNKDQYNEDTVKKDMTIYFFNTFAILKMLREVVVEIRQEMKDLIGEELNKIDQEYVVGCFVLAILVILSPLIIFLVRNAVTALQVFSTSVKTKARDLKREKRRAEGLVYQMLPKSVADNLRGNKSTSEIFDSATVCFTEIDGFKSIARACNPLQLFDLLNTIYKTFDARIDSNDVYKVETINDSYMVCSGIPERNGDRHAAEIANLCLELMFITPGIISPHDPSLRLKIRIGVHTGATTAGVVGSKMPRYCLFGDTVNVASRMQTTGEPMKIQMTYETKMLLDNLGGYTSEVRGQVEVKGKGLMDTYWLTGKV